VNAQLAAMIRKIDRTTLLVVAWDAQTLVARDRHDDQAEDGGLHEPGHHVLQEQGLLGRMVVLPRVDIEDAPGDQAAAGRPQEVRQHRQRHGHHDAGDDPRHD